MGLGPHLLYQCVGVSVVRGKVFQWFFRSTAEQQLNTPPGVAPSERLYVIGDVHGRNDLLVAMLDRIARDAAAISDGRKSRLVLLGDYVDRGDQSAQVLDTLSALWAQKSRTCDFLTGNHEAAMLAFLEDPIAGADWLDWGGRQTLTSYGIAPPPRKPGQVDLLDARDALHQKLGKHLPFLQSLKRYVVSGDVICAHASLDPTLSLHDQPDAALLWGQPPSGQKAGLPGHRLVHGHFADYQPVVRAERICVDTGAYYSGRLTAVRLDDTDTFLHVDVQDLLP